MNAPARVDVRVDLLAYARQHRLRTRNLHDGHPVPPGRGPKQGERGSQAFREERMNAIVGRFGYVTSEGNRLGWYVGELRQPGKRIRIIQAAGGIVTQLGDREAAGHAPFAALEKLVSAIGAYRTVSDETRTARASMASERFKRFGMPQRAGAA